MLSVVWIAKKPQDHSMVVSIRDSVVLSIHKRIRGRLLSISKGHALFQVNTSSTKFSHPKQRLPDTFVTSSEEHRLLGILSQMEELLTQLERCWVLCPY